MDNPRGSPRLQVVPEKKLLIAEHHPVVAKMIPHARQIVGNSGASYLLIPHRPAESKLLTNLGFSPPSPILSYYDWQNTTPFDSQRDTAAMMVDNHRGYILNEIGTGKTRAAMYALDYLMRIKDVRAALIIAPLSTLSTVWDREVFCNFPHLTTSVLYGTKDQRLQALAQPAQIYIINFHGVKTIRAALEMRTDITAVVVDELSMLRNHKTDLWKNINAVTKSRRYVWGMTGSPMPKHPTDAYAQVKLLTPENVPIYYKQFRDRTMFQLSQFRWKERDDANEHVYSCMQPAVRFSRKDCQDLPPTLYETLQVAMSNEQAAAYKRMLNDLYIQYKSGEIFAANEGVKVSKLLQISCGFAYDTAGAVMPLDVKDKLRTLKEIADNAGRKVIIFTPFVYSTSLLYEYLHKAGYSVATVHGGVNKKDRDLIFNKFQHSPEPKLLVAHPQCMSHGLTLTAANTIVWYSPTMSLETYIQANGRITRPGQTSNTLIIHIESTALERKIYKRLKYRNSMQGALLEMFESGDLNANN